jgi:hypothetical protein
MVEWQRKSRGAEENQARPAPYPAEKARQGEIILRKPWQRATFLAGLILPFVLAFIGWLIVWNW